MFEFTAIVIAFAMGLLVGYGASWVYHAPLRRREREMQAEWPVHNPLAEHTYVPWEKIRGEIQAKMLADHLELQRDQTAIWREIK
jgi:hypothetical protein